MRVASRGCAHFPVDVGGARVTPCHAMRANGAGTLAVGTHARPSPAPAPDAAAVAAASHHLLRSELEGAHAQLLGALEEGLPGGAAAPRAHAHFVLNPPSAASAAAAAGAPPAWAPQQGSWGLPGAGAAPLSIPTSLVAPPRPAAAQEQQHRAAGGAAAGEAAAAAAAAAIAARVKSQRAAAAAAARQPAPPPGVCAVLGCRDAARA